MQRSWLNLQGLKFYKHQFSHSNFLYVSIVFLSLVVVLIACDVMLLMHVLNGIDYFKKLSKPVELRLMHVLNVLFIVLACSYNGSSLRKNKDKLTNIVYIKRP